jgi:predicted transport protein
MPIFIINGKKVEKVKQIKLEGSGKEKQIQTLVEKNLSTIFDMIFIGSEIWTTHGGRIDTLAIDSDNRPVIIEYKSDKSSTILLQGLYYMDWLVENKAEFEKIVKLKIGKDVPINWTSGVRLLLIARSFEIWDKFAVNRIKESVELYEYALYENNELKLEKAALPKDFRSAPKTSITSISGSSVEDQMNKIKNDSIKNIVNDLRERIKLLSDDIQETATKDYIKFKSTVAFAMIYPQKNQFWFDVKLPKAEVKKKFSRLDVGNHKDTIFTHIRYREGTNIDHLVSLAEVAYQNTL